MNLLQQIPEGVTVAVDSAPIIYFLANTSPFADRFQPLFQAVEQGRNQIVISTITLAEVLTGPLRNGEEILAERYRHVLTKAERWSTIPLTEEIAERAARIRARYRLKLPDAVQVATALETGSHVLITHDRDFKSVNELPILGSSHGRSGHE